MASHWLARQVQGYVAAGLADLSGDMIGLMRTYLVLAGFVLLCLAVGLVGAFSTAPAIPAWYAALAKPSFNPPNWLFGPVWTVLYIAMAVAAWLIWKRPAEPARGLALKVWAAQLVLNALWTPVFFSLHRIGLALVDIVLLDLALAALIVVAWRPYRAAALLLVPYVAWTMFATALNGAIFRLN
jgi:tryptophan-rich sensory protein